MGLADDRAALIELIYDAALDPALWPVVLNRLTDLVGGHVGQISTLSLATGTFVDNSPRMPPEALFDYACHWVRRNPYIPRADHMRTGVVYHNYDVISREALRRTAIYHEFFAPHGLEQGIAVKLLADEAGQALIALWRDAGKDGFSAVETDLLSSIVPHLQRALRVSERIAAAQVARDASAEALDRLRQAVLLVDARCHVMFANSAGEAILTDGSGLHRGAGGILQARRSGETAQLHRLVAGAADRARGGEIGAGGTVQVSRRASTPALTVLVVTLRADTDWLRTRRPAAMLFVSDPARVDAPELAALRQDYGLTRMEAAVALRLLDGQGLTAAAATLGIAPTTARTHLNAAFGKTGTRTQVDLVRLLLQSGAVIRGR